MRRRLPIFFMLGFCGVAIDQASKYWARSALSEGEPVRWLCDHFLGLQLKYNYGASFSFAENHTWIFSVIGVCAVIIFPFFIRASKLWNMCLALMWAGALGNLFDRLFSGEFGRGAVTDFIVYSSWFTGNVADIFLVLGVFGILVLMLKQSLREKASENE